MKTNSRCVAVTEDLGLSYDLTNNTVNHADVRSLYYYQTNSQGINLYVGTDGGISKTTNGFDWVDITGEGLVLGQYYGLGVHPENTNILLAGAQDGSMNLYTNQDWYNAKIYGDNGDATFHPDNPEIVYQQNQGSLKKGALNGTTYSNISSTSNNDGSWMNPYEWNRGSQNELFVGKRKLNLINALPTNTPDPTHQEIYDPTVHGENLHISSVATSKSDPNIVYYSTDAFFWGQAGNTDDGIFKATRTGNNWSIERIGDDNLYIPNLHGDGRAGLVAPISDIIVDPNDVNRLWISRGGFKEGVKVFHSSDGGSSWAALSDDGLPNFPVISIEYQENAEDLLYIGTDVGVFYKNNTMACWERFGENGPHNMVSDMELNLCESKLTVSTFGRGIYQIDLIETGPQLCCGQGEDIFISGTQSINTNMDIPGNIIINPNSQLTITSTLKIGEGKRIVVKRGAKLIVDGAHLTRCDNAPNWRGITVEGNSEIEQPDVSALPSNNNAGIVHIKNNSLVEWARTAVSTNYYGNWTAEKWGGLVVCENSEFKFNRRVVEFLKYDFTNNSKFINCIMDGADPNDEITGETIGISMWDTDGITISKCHFKNMEICGVYALDSGPRIIDANTFEDNNIGIGTNASFPFGAFIDIGSHSETPNYFLNQTVYDIQSYATDKLDGINILNNEMFGSAINSVYLLGPTNYLIEKNAMYGSNVGVNSTHTGALDANQHNFIVSNQFNNLRGVIAIGKNRELQIKCNNNSNELEDIVVTNFPYDPDFGEIRAFQGTAADPADNCFTSPLPNADILTYGDTEPFIYFFSDSDCTIPQVPGNYTPEQTSQKGCNSGLLGDEYEIFFTEEQWINILQEILAIEKGGDKVTVKYYELLELREEMLQYFLSTNLANNDIEQAVKYLNQVNTTATNLIKYGIYLNEGMYVNAIKVLNKLPDNVSEMRDFKSIQYINIERLKNLKSFKLSPQQKSYLISIAKSTMGVRAYARSILFHLEGLQYIDKFDIPENSIQDPALELREDMVLEDIKLYPNPVADQLEILIPENIIDKQIIYTIFSASGNVILNDQKQAQEIMRLNVSDLQQGVYFISIRSLDGNNLFDSRFAKK